MCRTPLAMVAALMLVCGSAPVAQPGSASDASLDLVVIDVVVTDGKRNPITDLDRSEFRVKEDDRVVDIKTFAQVNAHGGRGPDEGRTVALLLDDTGVPALGTTSIQRLAKAVLTLASPGDDPSVVRLHARNDEAYGDMTEALARIDAYRGGVRPFDAADAQTDVLKQIAAMSRQLALTEGRRKALVCIGAQLICDVPEPRNDTRRGVEDAWVEAVSAAARANVAVYALVPERTRPRGGGIADATGGLTYGSFTDFREFVLALWNDSSRHYLIGYWPGPARRLHTIDVSVARPSARVRARRRRGQ